MTEITIAEKVDCLTRELRLRRRVYPRWVEQRKITQISADRELLVMQSIVDEYTEMQALLDEQQARML